MKKKFTIEELELIAPSLAQKAARHGLKSVSIDEVLSCCGRKHEQGWTGHASPHLQEKAREILAGARADLGHDLGGFSKVDLLLDNMPELMSVEAAKELLRSIGELSEGLKHEQPGQYSSLNDAAAVAGQYADLSPGSTEVWYSKTAFARLAYSGELDLGAVLPETHVLLGKIAETDPEAIYMALQGEIWSPNGEARTLISSKGLAHTSMSVGDVLVVRGQVLMVDSFGFKKVESMKKRLPVQEQNTLAASGPFALRQWLWKPMHLGVEKAPREQVNFRPGVMEGRMELRNQVCDTCRFLMPGWAEEEEVEEGVQTIGRCELVEGNVYGRHVCDLWQPDHLRTSYFLQKIHAAEAAMSGEPYQEHTDAEYVESAMEFIEAGENPDRVIDFLLDPEGDQKQERLRRHYRPDLSRSEMDDLASKLVAKGWDAKSDAPYLITDAPEKEIDEAEGWKGESLRHEQLGFINIDGTTYQVKSWGATWPPSIETESGFWLVAPEAGDLPWGTEILDVHDVEGSVASTLGFSPAFAQRVPGK